jgi:uncharacterized protein
MKTSTIVLSLLIAFTPAIGLAQQVREQAPPVIVVSSTAELQAPPDEATVRLGVVRQAPTAQAAQDQTNRAVQAILSEIAKLGVPAQKIQTSRLTLNPIYGAQRPDNREAPRVVAYNATNTVSIDLDNLARIGPVIDAGLTAGANQLEGVRFRLKDDLPIREKALRQAVAEAKRKAEVMAEALGVRIVGVLDASESGVSVIPREQFEFGAVARMAADQAPTPVSPGEIDIRASVTVRYQIAPR